MGKIAKEIPGSLKEFYFWVAETYSPRIANDFLDLFHNMSRLKAVPENTFNPQLSRAKEAMITLLKDIQL